MTVSILNFGSLNIDHVYTVARIVRPGQTLPSSGYRLCAGGKGGNQSVALARAGAGVDHAGRVGGDGRWLVDEMAALGVGVEWTTVDPDQTTGHAVVQVEAEGGENAILLYPGANQEVSRHQIEQTVSHYDRGDILLLQNEISNISHLLVSGRRQGLFICFNPAPFTPAVVAEYPLDCVDLLILNQIEAAGFTRLTPDHGARKLLEALYRHLRADTQILLTLGAEGAVLSTSATEVPLRTAALRAGPVVDTTGAGDTFIGCFLAARALGRSDDEALHRAAAAAAICVTRAGARDSIPGADEVDALLASHTQ